MSKDSNIPIYEQYENYEPPFNVQRAVERMVGTVPRKHLTGLGSIILTNEDALTGKRARRMTWSRGKKVSAAKARGLYHPEWGSNPAWIELHVDSIFQKYPRYFLRLKLTRELELGSTFFHELGHHIHAQHRPEFKEKEDVADVWKGKLKNNYLRKRFWYLFPVVAAIRWADERFDIQGRLRKRIERKRAAAAGQSI
jgi:hypothetical protein